ncbi:MAG: formylglycine-generating enzyme family protein [Coleofasciculaceae cyanobacterium RL_1_1]|nr:formylglycine-generating enzyme family protein [Coleofasciculaceae cyanobacterium RL_1_1]
MPDGTPPKTKILTRRTRRTGRHFYEALSDDVQLDMMLIPAGTFLMGSSDDDETAYDNEKPQHEVSVPQFFIGRTPITQAQWRTVAGYPQADRELNPDRSRFKGDNRPVENVDWDDAREFCERLSRHTNRQYRLPSEAEWEYACRAGTQTPFSFGNYISTELANYNGSAFGDSPKCESKGETTEVGAYPPNPWGLHDMHGNVWEWCEDDWHRNYKGAPTDGSAWIEENRTETKLLRGGSWNLFPRYCRSAVRSLVNRDVRYNFIGFRVVCVPPRAL